MWLFLPNLLAGRLGATTRLMGLLSLAGAVGIGLTPGDKYPVGHAVVIGMAAVPALGALVLTCVGTWRGREAFSRVYALATSAMLAVVLAHFSQYVAHFWMGMEWTPVAPAMQKIAIICGLVWVGWSGLLIGRAAMKNGDRLP